MEILTKRKKRKNLLYISENSMPPEEAISTLSEMNKRLFRVFRNHIGEENAISPAELFEKVIGIPPESVDIFKREYLWTVLKRLMSALRMSNTLFIINRKSKLFVLKSKTELNKYKEEVDRHITVLHSLKDKATEWVEDEKWRKL